MKIDACRDSAKRFFAGVLSSLVGIVAVSSLASAQASSAQASSAPAFCNGERLTFVVSTARLGKIGDAVMSLTGPVDVRGRQVLLASFETHIAVALMRASNASNSWIDPSDLTSLRFVKHEHRPFSSSDDSVDIFPARHRWEDAQGASGTVTSDHPLDELSFIYFLRTLSFAPDSTYAFDRHYDTRRSPTTVRVVKREAMTTPAGEFQTVELEMRVKDGKDYKGNGVLHLWISDDRCRLPVRIESDMPLLGVGILILDSVTALSCGAGGPAARMPQLEN